MQDDTIRAAFLGQAKACDALGSPFTARLCRATAAHLTPETAVGQRILNWQGDPSHAGDSVPLRLAGALHALVLLGKIDRLTDITNEDALWQAIETAFQQHGPFILERLKSPPQTNEVRRSGALLPGFLTIASLFGKPLGSPKSVPAPVSICNSTVTTMISAACSGAMIQPCASPPNGMARPRHRPRSQCKTEQPATSTRSIHHPMPTVCG